MALQPPPLNNLQRSQVMQEVDRINLYFQIQSAKVVFIDNTKKGDFAVSLRLTIFVLQCINN